MEEETGNKQYCPVSIGEKLELECISIGTKGDGVFDEKGMIIIVPNTEVGNTYKIESTAIRARVAFGKVI